MRKCPSSWVKWCFKAVLLNMFQPGHDGLPHLTFEDNWKISTRPHSGAHWLVVCKESDNRSRGVTPITWRELPVTLEGREKRLYRSDCAGDFQFDNIQVVSLAQSLRLCVYKCITPCVSKQRRMSQTLDWSYTGNEQSVWKPSAKLTMAAENVNKSRPLCKQCSVHMCPSSLRCGCSSLSFHLHTTSFGWIDLTPCSSTSGSGTKK